MSTNIAWDGSSIASEEAYSTFENAPLTYEMCTEAIAAGGKCYDAMYNLAQLLEHGAQGVPADPARAVELYTKAAEEGGHLYAMHCLAAIHESGECGLKKNSARAVALYTRCIASGGEEDSMINLAIILKDGAEGVPADPKRSLDLYMRAIAEFNSADALPYLAELLADGSAGVTATSELLRSICDVVNNLRSRHCLEHGSIVKAWYELHSRQANQDVDDNDWLAGEVLGDHQQIDIDG